MNAVPISDGAAPVAADVPDFAGASEFAAALSGIDGALERAAGAEAAFVAGRGSLADMVIDRARADVALSVAAAGASHLTTAVSTILGMQV